MALPAITNLEDYRLTRAEIESLHQCETIIERGLNTFYEVGKALMEIRDSRLYREQHGTFEEYCQQRWGLGRNYANKLIGAAGVIENLGTIVPRLPENEQQVRPLTQLQPDEQQLVWQVVQETAPEGKITAAHVKSVVDTLKELRDSTPDDLTSVIVEKQDKKLASHQLIQQSLSNEWYTPAEYLEAARYVMGGIDIDPASNDYANQRVQAGVYYTSETNGLEQEWHGRCWLNPPYGRMSGAFIQRLTEQYKAGNVTEAVVLLNAHSAETDWFAPLWDHLLCFTDHRINFESPDGVKDGSTHGSVFIYLGQNERAFHEAFKQFGYVVKQVRW